MSKRQPTHKVSFYGVHCYNDDRTGELWGCNWLWSLFIMPAVLWHEVVCFCCPGYGDQGFPLRVLEEYK